MAVVYKPSTCERNEIRNASKLPVAFIRVESEKNAAPLVQVRSTFRHLSISSQVLFVTIGATPSSDM